ncbi:MAG: PEP-CTERM sorting domain-containing protein [Phycisphaerae bacterium]|nr:PEP-CTERM sorting domain-containing protein [Phycisphaerae bacterium]
MIKENVLKVLLIGLLISVSANAATVFNNTAGDNDFNNAANWDNGLPVKGGGHDGVINADATMTASHEMVTAIDWHLVINATVNTGANELQLRSGSKGTNPIGTPGDLIVGDNATGVFNVDNGGTLDIAGIGADLIIGQNGGTGTVNFLSGSSSSLSKTIEILNGSLNYASDVNGLGHLGDELVVGNNGILSMGINADTDTHFVFGNRFDLELATDSTLKLNFTGSASIGDSWTLMQTISSFNGVVDSSVDAGDGTGVFGNLIVNGLTDDQQIQLIYNAPVAGDDGSLVATVVPEPATLALLGLGSLISLKRRRKN